jgi:hypothetical protein
MGRGAASAMCISLEVCLGLDVKEGDAERSRRLLGGDHE